VTFLTVTGWIDFFVSDKIIVNIMADEVKHLLVSKMPDIASSKSLNESEDILEGEEPGAGQGAMLVKFDSYEDISGFIGSDSLNGSQLDTPSSSSSAKVERRRGGRKREETDRLNARDLGDDDVSSQNGSLVSDDATIHRIDTTSTLDGGEVSMDSFRIYITSDCLFID